MNLVFYPPETARARFATHSPVARPALLTNAFSYRAVDGVGEGEIIARLEELKRIEAALVSEPDPQFRFHSGVPL